MYKAIGYIGAKTLPATDSFRNILIFAARILLRIFTPATYNSATRMVLVNQIYFTAIQILPLFIMVSLITGILGLGLNIQLIKNLGFPEALVPVLMSIIVTEVVPLTVTALVTLRSGAAMNTEISVMKVNKELDALDAFRIDPIDYLYVPRVLAGVITLLFLSGIALVVIFVSGLLTAILFFGVARDHELALLISALDFSDMILMFAKAGLFGFFITLIPIWFGLSASRQLTGIPVAVLNGMLKVFIAILIIEVLSLTIRFI